MPRRRFYNNKIKARRIRRPSRWTSSVRLSVCPCPSVRTSVRACASVRPSVRPSVRSSVRLSLLFSVGTCGGHACLNVVHTSSPSASLAGGHTTSPFGLVHIMLQHDTVSERLRRWTRNPLGSARRGSNPLGVVCDSRHMQTHRQLRQLLAVCLRFRMRCCY